MLNELEIYSYRKLKNSRISFTDNVNVISGTNGTCKTSLLHLISNSFQVPNKKCSWIQNPACIDALNKMNGMINPKVETLTKGDIQYRDPAPGYEGALYEAYYSNGQSLAFRRHNSKGTTRYSVKPYYKTGHHDTLPFCPVIYLGLSRLYPFGQFMDEDALKRKRNYLPIDYIEEMDEIYNRLTGMQVSQPFPQDMGVIKSRSVFKTQIKGVDSNTISDGEDNLYIILTALECLKFYTESISDLEHKFGILLVDEYDATLHPSLQVNLLRILINYSIKYHIQVIFTTHSLSTLEEALKKKLKVIYLIDNVNKVDMMEQPDIYKIRMFLYGMTKDDIFSNKSIPIFTEDEEARELLKVLLDYFRDNFNDFRSVRAYFHLVDAKLGSDNLRSIFKDDYLINTTLGAICILDGDQGVDFRHNIICLPGKKSPEKFLMDYAEKLYSENDEFWSMDSVLSVGYNATYYRDKIRPDVEKISHEIEALATEGKSTRSINRTRNKEVFRKHKEFWIMIFKYWLQDSYNDAEIKKFYIDFHNMFLKVSQRCGINPQLWK